MRCQVSPDQLDTPCRVQTRPSKVLPVSHHKNLDTQTKKR
nr:MAG TPA: hypothetical protein [Caudoviricetes sp.]